MAAVLGRMGGGVHIIGISRNWGCGFMVMPRCGVTLSNFWRVGVEVTFTIKSASGRRLRLLVHSVAFNCRGTIEHRSV